MPYSFIFLALYSDDSVFYGSSTFVLVLCCFFFFSINRLIKKVSWTSRIGAEFSGRFPSPGSVISTTFIQNRISPSC